MPMLRAHQSPKPKCTQSRYAKAVDSNFDDFDSHDAGFLRSLLLINNLGGSHFGNFVACM
jgi:hypothetical protein